MVSDPTSAARSILKIAPDAEGDDPVDSSDGLNSAAEDLASALATKDTAGIASALRNAFAILGAEPLDAGDGS